jgi:bifunctional non-homologous end joining protein LigD
MNPADKRLAIMVEDHDIEYGDFEGTIPEGQYGAGSVVIWDKGTYELTGGAIESGRLEFKLNGSKLRGMFALIKLKGKDKQWLLIKKKDEFSDQSFKLTTLLPDKSNS